MLKFHRLTFVLAALIGLGLLIAPDAMAGSSPAGAVVVVDANGKIVGPYNDGFGGGVNTEGALVSVVGQTFKLAIEANSGFSGTDITLYYTTSDCSGQAYMSNESPVYLIQPGKVVNGLLYYEDFKTDSEIPIAGPSEININFAGQSGPCTPQPRVFVQVFPAHTFDLSTLGFTAPFSVRLR